MRGAQTQVKASLMVRRLCHSLIPNRVDGLPTILRLFPGSNMLLARLATKKAKPDGQFHLTGDLVEDFMSQQTVRDLPG